MQTPQGIAFTPEAIAAAKRLQAEVQDYAGLALRVYLAGKGCSGFDYGVAFDQPLADDRHFAQGDLDVVVDAQALSFIAGSTVEWVDDERGRGFLVQNPRHRKFRGKFFKRPQWQEKLNSAPPNEG